MSKRLSIPIGVDDYKDLIDKGSVYVDKTLLIKEFWDDGSKIILVPRPRRFGKTLNLSMLQYFFEKTTHDNAYLFEKTNIWQHVDYRELQGQFCVIFLTFKDVKVNTWGEAYRELTNLLAHELERLIAPIYTSLTAHQQRWYNAILEQTATSTDYTNSLLYATQMLEQYYKKKVIVLVDEYDAPITHAYLKGYYSQMVEFMRNLLSKALKTNSAVERAFLTGIMRTAKEGVFSGLNNLKVCTILNEQYSDKFGFTQKEVDQLLLAYDLTEKKEEIKHWYDGYIFGQTLIYNPWSVLNCIDNKGMFKLYWANTSDNELIKNLIGQATRPVKDDIENLLQSKSIVDKEIEETVSLPDLARHSKTLWSTFLFTGYLTTATHEFRNGVDYYTLAVPNEEVAMLYKQLVATAINQTIISGEVTELFKALMTGDIHTTVKLLQEFVANSCSFYDLPKNDPERSIHLFVLGILAGLSGKYVIQSNRESGDGRYDIMLMPKDKNDPGILIEFKKAPNMKLSTLEKAALQALHQIENLDYKSFMRNFGYRGRILCYGIAICGKHLVVKMEVID